MVVYCVTIPANLAAQSCGRFERFPCAMVTKREIFYLVFLRRLFIVTGAVVTYPCPFNNFGV